MSTTRRGPSRRTAAGHDPLAGLTLAEARLLLEVSTAVGVEPTLEGQLRCLLALLTRATDADRGTLFVNDPRTQELYSRESAGGLAREIRLLNTVGIAGHVFQSGEGLLVDDAYTDERFTAPWTSRRATAPTRSPARRCAPWTAR